MKTNKAQQPSPPPTARDKEQPLSSPQNKQVKRVQKKEAK